MQIIESLVFILTIVILVVLIKSKSIKKQHISPLLLVTLASFTIHIVFESSRWQIYPMYIAVVLVIAMGVFARLRIKEYQNMKAMRIVILITSTIFLLLSGVSSFAFPLYDMPLTSGEFSIGTESFVLIDNDRDEIYGAAGSRKIKIQMWYPAKFTEGYDLVPWLEDGRVVAQALAKDMNLPLFVLDHTELTISNSYREAPISDDSEKYPVVVISHGWRGFRNLHTDIAEELASFGYVVVAIDHTYGSVATVFNDEEIAFLNLDALPERDTTSDFLEYANKLVSTYAGDITLTLNKLEMMNTGDVLSRFAGRLDLTSIGLLGHSTGGGADVAVAINDERIKAVIGMDAWVEPIYESEIEKGLNIPALFLRSGWWEDGLNNSNLLSLIDNSSGGPLLYQIDGTTHYDFSMVYMYSPLTKYMGLTGEVEGDYLVSILENTIITFFDQNLKGVTSVDIENIDELWEEVRKIE